MSNLKKFKKDIFNKNNNYYEILLIIILIFIFQIQY